MKKHTAVFLLIAASAIAAALCLTACAATELERCASRIADYRPVLLEGESNGITVAVISGVRETPYSLDGALSGEKTDYTVITVRGADGDDIPAKAVFDGTEENFTLKRHPFGDGHSAELPVRLDDDITTFTVEVDGKEITAASGDVGVDGEYALTLARETVTYDGGEIVLRLTRNSVTGRGIYWYAAFVSEDHSSSVLIDAASGEVRAVREE